MGAMEDSAASRILPFLTGDRFLPPLEDLALAAPVATTDIFRNLAEPVLRIDEMLAMLRIDGAATDRKVSIPESDILLHGPHPRERIGSGILTPSIAQHSHQAGADEEILIQIANPPRAVSKAIDAGMRDAG